jgi:hypothetical protein
MADRPPGLRRETCLLAPVLLALFLCAYSAVSPTNFGGYDEWLIRSLSDRLVLNVPYANRPLNFLWTVPGGLLDRGGFTGYYVLHGVYLWLAGVLLFVALRRLWPEVPCLAFLAAAVVVTWAPSDRARLGPVQGTFCSGATMSVLLAVVLLLEARRRGQVLLLLAAGAVAWATIRGYEATLPLLLAAPVLVRRLPAPGAAWRPASWLAWAGPVALATAQTMAAAFLSGEARYQMENARLDPRPAAVASRLLHQYERHLAPLVASAPRELRSPRVALAAILLVAGILLVRRGRRNGITSSGWASALVPIAGGLAAAGLGYAPYALSPIGASTDRTQYVSGPGIAAAIAAAIVLLARTVPPRWRWLAQGALGAWVVAVGTGRTLAMQRHWDRATAYPGQAATLDGLRAVAPDLRPGTLVVLVDHCGDWPAVFAFRPAVEWTYGRRATGFLWRPALRGQLFYPTVFGAGGVRTVPWESIQEAWDDPPTEHRYDEIVAVLKQRDDCRVTLAQGWPGELPPLPPGARYAPQERILGRAFP